RAGCSNNLRRTPGRFRNAVERNRLDHVQSASERRPPPDRPDRVTADLGIELRCCPHRPCRTKGPHVIDRDLIDRDVPVLPAKGRPGIAQRSARYRESEERRTDPTVPLTAQPESPDALESVRLEMDRAALALEDRGQIRHRRPPRPL